MVQQVKVLASKSKKRTDSIKLFSDLHIAFSGRHMYTNTDKYTINACDF